MTLSDCATLGEKKKKKETQRGETERHMDLGQPSPLLSSLIYLYLTQYCQNTSKRTDR